MLLPSRPFLCALGRPIDACFLVLESTPVFLSLPSPPATHTPHTHFSTLGQNDDELNVNANDTIVIIQNLGDGWLRVRKGQDEGYVPESYVRIVDE